jgi:hypothetical protein
MRARSTYGCSGEVLADSPARFYIATKVRDKKKIDLYLRRSDHLRLQKYSLKSIKLTCSPQSSSSPASTTINELPSSTQGYKFSRAPKRVHI